MRKQKKVVLVLVPTVGSEEGKPEAKLREKQFLRKSTDDAGAQAIVRGGRSW